MQYNHRDNLIKCEYEVVFLNKDNDTCYVTVNAKSEKEARDYVVNNYPNFYRILHVLS